MADEVWWDGVFNESFDVWFETPAVGPHAHVGAVAEVRSEMVGSLRPGCELAGTEAAVGFDFVGGGLPRFHV